jgi:glycolate dehydrogenase FAD-linked subunit
MCSAVVRTLRGRLPEASVITDRDLLASYRYDRAMLCDAGWPAAVVIARSTEDVAITLSAASDHRVPVVPQGARSGLSGAANAIDEGIVLTVEKMNRVLEVDVANRLVVTQPGVFNADLSRAVAERGLFYPPDPSSWEFCSVGGNLATNSGGLCCVKYGVTTDYVLGLEVVLASGEVLRTGRRTVKGVAGYDLTRLFVGSEGTLGVITEATLSLRPEAERPLTVAAVFPDTESACEAISAVVAAGLVPSLLEFMDQTSVRAVNDSFQMGFSEDTAALVLAQSDSGPQRAPEELAEIVKICESAGAFETAVADDPQEGELLLAARREVLTAFEKLGTTMIDDVCVPRDRLAKLVAGIDAIAQASELIIGVVGHAGDGNFHPTVVFDQHDPEQVRTAKKAFDDVMVLSLELGGTITGEHGVGVLKKELLAREVGDLSLRIHGDIKRSLDPLGILNPGKVFDL